MSKIRKTSVTHKYGKTICHVREVKGSIPLLFVQGGPGGAHHSARKLFRLPRTVILYDQVGCGESSVLLDRRKWKIGIWVHELECLINKFGRRGIHLMGHSWGCMVAVDYLISRKRKINSVILSSPMLSVSRWKRDAKKLLLKLNPKDQEIIRENEGSGTTHSLEYKFAEKEYVKRFVYRLSTKGKNQRIGETFFNSDIYNFMWGPSEFCPTGNLKNYERIKSLYKIKHPVLVSCGRHDEATPLSCKEYAANMPFSFFKVFPKSSHSALHEETELYLKTILNYIREFD